MNKKEILNCLENFPLCNNGSCKNSSCKKCICDKTMECYENNDFTICCQHFLYIMKQYIAENNFKNLCSFLKGECGGGFPFTSAHVGKKWFVPFFKNNSLELE